MNVIRHDDIFVKLEFSSITIFEECGDHEFSNFRTLEEVLLHVCTGRNEVSRHSVPGLKPLDLKEGGVDANLKVRSTMPAGGVDANLKVRSTDLRDATDADLKVRSTEFLETPGTRT